MDCVQECAELSMQKAVDSAKSTSDYPTNGEVYLLLVHTVYVYCWCEYNILCLCYYYYYFPVGYD